VYALSAAGKNSYILCEQPMAPSLARAVRTGLWPTSRSFAANRRGAALAEHVLLVAVILVGLVGILFGMQSHLRQMYTRADNQMGVADCGAGGCSGASAGGSAGGASGGSGGSPAGSSGGSGTGGGGIVLGGGGQTPTGGPDASNGSGGGSGGGTTQPVIHVPPQ